MKTNKYYTEAENDTFYCQSTYDGTLIHKATGKAIYQMYWLDDNGCGAEPVIGDVREQVIAFWHELRSIQDEAETARRWASINTSPSAEDIAHAKFVADMEDEYSDY